MENEATTTIVGRSGGGGGDKEGGEDEKKEENYGKKSRLPISAERSIYHVYAQMIMDSASPASTMKDPMFHSTYSTMVSWSTYSFSIFFLIICEYEP